MKTQEENGMKYQVDRKGHLKLLLYHQLFRAVIPVVVVSQGHLCVLVCCYLIAWLRVRDSALWRL